MEKVVLFNPRFVGLRFEDSTLPFDLLDDLSTYQELLFQVAKDVYYKKNGRKRVPNGFGNGVYLKLGEIKDGSAIPQILLAAASFFAGTEDTKPYFEEAQNLIIHTIAASYEGKDPNNLLSAEALSYFNKIGRDLKDDETIEFAPNINANAKLNQDNRRRLVLASPNVTTVESEVIIRGNIITIGKDPHHFTIQTRDDVRLHVPVGLDDYKIVEKAYLDLKQDQRVLITGIGEYNKQNKLETIKGIEQIVLLDKQDVPTQLEKFISLHKGWMNGEGESFGREDIGWLSKQISTFTLAENYCCLSPSQP